MKLKLIILICLFLVLLTFARELIRKDKQAKLIFVKQALSITIEIAETEKQRQIGLMHRKQLAKNTGMLFVFDTEAIQKVWMKDTLVPLDVIFFSEQGIIISFLKQLQPCYKKVCDIFQSTGKAKYMLEINAGTIDKEKIEMGQKMILRDENLITLTLQSTHLNEAFLNLRQPDLIT